MEHNNVIIKDVDISFGHMVSLFFKAFPAFILASAVWWVLLLVLVFAGMAMLGGLGAVANR